MAGGGAKAKQILLVFVGHGGCAYVAVPHVDAYILIWGDAASDPGCLQNSLRTEWNPVVKY